MASISIWKWRNGKSTSETRSLLRVTRMDERITPSVNSSPIFAVGSGRGMDATVKVYDSSGTLLSTFLPYPLPGGTFFGGGVDVAIGDINGDTVPDVITGAGSGGGPHVKVFNGVDIAAGSPNPAEIRSFYAYAPLFTGGVNVAGGDVNGDNLIDILTGAGPSGGPHAKAFGNGNQNNLLMSFYAYEETFRGGVRVAAGDIGGDGTSDEFVTGAGEGGGPKIGVYDYVPNANPSLTHQKFAEFFAYDSTLRGGVSVASGYTTNNRDASNNLYADIVAGSGVGSSPEVKTFRLLDAMYDALGNPSNFQFFNAGNLVPYASTFTGGVHVGILRNGGLDDFLVAPGAGMAPDQRIYNQETDVMDLETYTPTQRFQQFPFAMSFTAGIEVS